MKIKDDELNNYIDNNLSNSELEKLNKKLLSDADAMEKLKSLKAVDNILKNLITENAPQNFTAAAMQKIYESKRNKNFSGKYFYMSVVSFLSLIIIAFTGYGIYTHQPSLSYLNSKLFNQFGNSFTEGCNKFSSFLFANMNKNIFLFVALIIVLSFCFAIVSYTKSINELKMVDS